MTSLRDRLRTDTAPKHGGVDRSCSFLDLAQPDGLRTFLRVQMSGLLKVRCRPGHYVAAVQDLGSRMVAAFEADPRDLDDCPVARVGKCRLHATAMLLMLLGSSLGTRVLCRHWLETEGPAVTTAGRCLDRLPPHGAWRHFCEELAERPAEGADTDRIVRVAGGLFDLPLAALVGRTFQPDGAPHA